MKDLVELVCCNPTCNKVFKRKASEHRRNIKIGRKVTCCLRCSGVINAKNLGNNLKHGNPKFLIANNRRDEFTGFRYYIRKCKERTPGSNISVEDIKQQWEAQNGLCAYTGLPVVLREDKFGNPGKKPYEIASLDRIDSNKPYEKGNIQFTSISINFMKGTMSDSDVKLFISKIRERRAN